MNLRLGNDFVSSESGLHGYRKNPASFWSPALQKVRLETGIEKAIMISDGSEHQIRRMFVEEGETMEIAQNQKCDSGLVDSVEFYSNDWRRQFFLQRLGCLFVECDFIRERA